MLLQLQKLTRNNAAIRIFFPTSVPIILVIILCQIESLERKNSSVYVLTFRGQLSYFFISQLLLSFIHVKDGRPILSANVFALSVILGRIVDGEEDVQKF